jgi:hypothetical protein
MKKPKHSKEEEGEKTRNNGGTHVQESKRIT